MLWFIWVHVSPSPSLSPTRVVWDWRRATGDSCRVPNNAFNRDVLRFVVAVVGFLVAEHGLTPLQFVLA
jgi:hypothetical protein